MKKQSHLKYMLMTAAASACLAAFPASAQAPAGDNGEHMDAPPPSYDGAPPPPHHRPPRNAAENGGVPPSPDDMRDADTPRIGSSNGSPASGDNMDTGLPGTRMGGNDAPPPGGGGVPRLRGESDK